jgi:hypothetical protein
VLHSPRFVAPCALVCALLVAACAADDASERWAGTVDTLANGAVRVSSPVDGLWSEEDRWQLEPVLAIGRVEGEGPDVFGSIADIEVGGDGRIYVLDRQVNELRVFAADGTHLGTTGRTGAGPGEFTRVTGLYRITGDSVLVADVGNARYAVFDADGNFGRTVVRPIRSYGWVSEGTFAGGVLYEEGYRPTGGDASDPVIVGVRLAEQSELTDTLGFPKPPVPPIEGFYVRSAEGGSGMSMPFAPEAAWQLMPDRSLWWGFASEYRLLHLSPAGDTLRDVVSASTPLPVTQQEIDAWAAGRSATRFKQQGGELDLSRIPRQKPYFQDLFVDPAGYLWVDVPTTDALTAFDIFDPAGRFLGRLPTGVDRDTYVDPVLRDDLLHLVVTDSLGVAKVAVFRIRRSSP